MKVRGIVLNPEKGQIYFTRIADKAVANGTLMRQHGQTHLVNQKHSFQRWKPWYRRGTYVLLKDGDARPLAVVENGLSPDSYSSHVFDSAIRSRIADRVLRTGLRWEIVAMIMLGAIAAIAIIRGM